MRIPWPIWTIFWRHHIGWWPKRAICLDRGTGHSLLLCLLLFWFALLFLRLLSVFAYALALSFCLMCSLFHLCACCAFSLRLSVFRLRAPFYLRKLLVVFSLFLLLARLLPRLLSLFAFALEIDSCFCWCRCVSVVLICKCRRFPYEHEVRVSPLLGLMAYPSYVG